MDEAARNTLDFPAIPPIFTDEQTAFFQDLFEMLDYAFGRTAAFDGNLTIDNALTVTEVYFGGRKDSNGTFRLRVDNGIWVVEKRESGTWNSYFDVVGA